MTWQGHTASLWLVWDSNSQIPSFHSGIEWGLLDLIPPAPSHVTSRALTSPLQRPTTAWATALTGQAINRHFSIGLAAPGSAG